MRAPRNTTPLRSRTQIIFCCAMIVRSSMSILPVMETNLPVLLSLSIPYLMSDEPSSPRFRGFTNCNQRGRASSVVSHSSSAPHAIYGRHIVVPLGFGSTASEASGRRARECRAGGLPEKLCQSKPKLHTAQRVAAGNEAVSTGHTIIE